MSSQILRDFHAAWSRADYETLRQLLAPDCINYNLVTGEQRGIDFELEACRIWHAGFSDVNVRIQQILEKEDRVVVHWQLASRHTGEFMGIAPTQKFVTVPGIEINRVADGRIAEIWRLSDGLSVMQQLGAM
jgi:predicted ester cyclase